MGIKQTAGSHPCQAYARDRTLTGNDSSPLERNGAWRFRQSFKLTHVLVMFIDARNIREPRTLPQPLAEIRDTFFRPTGEDFDTAIGQIQRPSPQPETPAFRCRTRAKKNPLHTTADAKSFAHAIIHKLRVIATCAWRSVHGKGSYCRSALS